MKLRVIINGVTLSGVTPRQCVAMLGGAQLHAFHYAYSVLTLERVQGFASTVEGVQIQVERE